MIRFILCFLILFSFSKYLFADATPVILEEGKDFYEIGLNLDILEDPTGKLTIDDVNNVHWMKKFKKSNKKKPNFGFSQSVFWARFKLKNKRLKDINWVLSQNYYLQDEISFFKKSNGKWEESKAGNLFSFSKREFNMRSFSFMLNPKEDIFYFVRIRGSVNRLNLTIRSQKNSLENEAADNLKLGLFFGLILAIFLYNFFIFISTRSISYFYYCIYVLSYGLVLSIYQGFSQKYIFKDFPWMSNNGLSFLIGVVGLSLMLFTINFLKLRNSKKILYKINSLFCVVSVLVIISSFIFPYGVNLKIYVITAFIGMAIVFVTGLYRIKEKHRPSLYFILAFSFMVLGIVINSLMSIGILPVNLFTTQAMLIGTALQLIVFSMGPYLIKEEAPANNLENEVMGRIHGLDALRAILMILGVVIHTVLSYMPVPWPYLDVGANSIFLGGIPDFIHTFRMPAFFLLSGFFGALLWKNRGPKGMVKNRFQRLVLPFFIFLVILWPIQAYFYAYAFKFRMGALSPLGVDETIKIIFPPRDTMHLWFLYYLIIVTMIVSGIARLMERFSFLENIIVKIIKVPWKFVLVFGGLNVLWCIVLNWWEIPTSTGWVPNLSILVYYIFFYSIGWILFNSKFDLSVFKNYVWRTLFLAWALFLVRELGNGAIFEVIPIGGWPSPFDEKSTWEVIRIVGLGLSMILFIRGFIGLFLRYANSGNAIWRYISDSSYWIFLFHQFIAFIVPPILERWDVHVAIKFPVATLIVFIFCLSTYDFFVRSTFIGEFLNGRKFPRYSLGLSGGVTFITTIWMAFLLLNPEPFLERPSPWLKGQLPKDLLPQYQVTYPFVKNDIKSPHAELSRCAKVDHYIICPDGVQFKNVPALCAKFGGKMPIFHKEEYEYFQEWLERLLGRPVWLALTDTKEEGTWVWTDGSESIYSRWIKGQPDNYRGNEDCAVANWWGTKRWNDVACDGYYGFICQLDKK